MIYEYMCSFCNDEFEHEQKISDESLKDCIKCGKKNSLKKVISAGHFILKGNGWYKKGGF